MNIYQKIKRSNNNRKKVCDGLGSPDEMKNSFLIGDAKNSFCVANTEIVYDYNDNVFVFRVYDHKNKLVFASVWQTNKEKGKDTKKEFNLIGQNSFYKRPKN
jgi:hypothetical protein